MQPGFLTGKAQPTVILRAAEEDCILGGVMAQVFHCQRLQTHVARRKDIAGASGIRGGEHPAITADPHFIGIAGGKDDGVDVGVDRAADVGRRHADVGATDNDFTAIERPRPHVR